VRDAVRAARKALPGWAGKTAYNRGQTLYRAAEALESRASEFGELAVRLRGEDGTAEVAAAVDTLVHYAGWTDKLAAVLGGVNPVAAPFLSFSLPEPTGVVGVVAPEEPELLGLIGAIAPALAAGNTVVAICSERWPLAGLDLGEVLAVSDVPAGVVNLLAGRRGELATALGAHRDLNAIVDASADPALGEELDRLAAETVKRVLRIGEPDGLQTAREDSLRRLEGVVELKTAWHPIGA
jgi:acyl-CoA reductase-like NAD-dependent aldehyde dehydrogenase